MFPRPAINFLPRIYRENPEEATLALAAFLDSLINDVSDELLELCNLYNLARAPSNIIDELGYMLNADLQPGDSDRLRRQKVSIAVEGHRRRGTWLQDAKPKIDAVVGGDSQLVKMPGVGSDDFIMVGGRRANELTAANLWGVMGGGRAANELAGPLLVGRGNELNLAGVVYIDIDNATITQDIVDDIEFALRDVVPAYFMIVYGITVAGEFVPFPLPGQSGPLLTEDGRRILTEDGANFLIAEGSRL